jgi:hypothetical protein
MLQVACLIVCGIPSLEQCMMHDERAGSNLATQKYTTSSLAICQSSTGMFYDIFPRNTLYCLLNTA